MLALNTDYICDDALNGNDHELVKIRECTKSTRRGLRIVYALGESASMFTFVVRNRIGFSGKFAEIYGDLNNIFILKPSREGILS